jgi:hypothetical protein
MNGLLDFDVKPRMAVYNWIVNIFIHIRKRKGWSLRGLDPNQLGTSLMLLKKSGHVDIMISDYPSSLTLPNAISKVYLTELGRKTLKETK